MTRLPLYILIVCFALLLAIPTGKGDLPGYDDALYAHIAKEVYLSGDWLDLRSNGYPALEHPPLLPWIEALFFNIFGLSDTVVRIPSAACGFGTILLVWWLARRLFDEATAYCAMFAMGTSLYFLKYAAHAMTDVPFAFFFLCAVCCWKLADDSPRWLPAVGAFTAAAQMTRGMMGLALLLLFGFDLLLARRRPAWGWLAAGAIIAFAPPLLWYWHLVGSYGEFYLQVHKQFLAKDIVAPNPLTSLLFIWMLAKSYWPWFPAMLAGLYLTRNRLLLLWIGFVLSACAVVRNPVLRYLLPAYPAFAIAAGAAISRIKIPIWIGPAVAAIAVVVAAALPTHPQADKTKPIALAATRATKFGERIAFYDEGQPRFDETNQLQWYGDRTYYILENPAALDQAILQNKAKFWILDRTTKDARFPGAAVLAEAGHLVLCRLRSPEPPVLLH